METSHRHFLQGLREAQRSRDHLVPPSKMRPRSSGPWSCLARRGYNIAPKTRLQSHWWEKGKLVSPCMRPKILRLSIYGEARAILFPHQKWDQGHLHETNTIWSRWYQGHLVSLLAWWRSTLLPPCIWDRGHAVWPYIWDQGSLFSPINGRPRSFIPTMQSQIKVMWAYLECETKVIWSCHLISLSTVRRGYLISPYSWYLGRLVKLCVWDRGCIASLWSRSHFSDLADETNGHLTIQLKVALTDNSFLVSPTVTCRDDRCQLPYNQHNMATSGLSNLPATMAAIDFTGSHCCWEVGREHVGGGVSNSYPAIITQSWNSSSDSRHVSC